MSILFASTSLLTLTGGNSIIAKSIGSGENIASSRDVNSFTKNSFTKKEEEILLAWKKMDSKYELLLEKSIQNPSGISEGELKGLVDEFNKTFYEISDKYGHQDDKMTQDDEMTTEKLRSMLMKDVEDARRNPSKRSDMRGLKNQYQLLLEKAMRNPREITEEDLKGYVDESNKLDNKYGSRYGSSSELTQEKLRSRLMKDVEDARRNPSLYNKLQEA